MTNPSLEDQARCEAALRGVKYMDVPLGWIEGTIPMLQTLPPHSNLPVAPADITTADGREAIMELCRFQVLPWSGMGWYVPAFDLTADTYAEAITAAWYAYVNKWKQESEMSETDPTNRWLNLINELEVEVERLLGRLNHYIDLELEQKARANRAEAERDRLREWLDEYGQCCVCSGTNADECRHWPSTDA